MYHLKADLNNQNTYGAINENFQDALNGTTPVDNTIRFLSNYPVMKNHIML